MKCIGNRVFEIHSQLKLSERDLASLVRNNTTPTFYQVDENLSAADQFDDSLIGQKSYARTQVYSGKKNNIVPMVVSLQEICVNLLMNHIDSKYEFQCVKSHLT